MTPRERLVAAYRAAVAAVDPRSRVSERLAATPLTPPVYLAAVGKAAAGMADGALDAGLVPADSLVIHPEGSPPPCHPQLTRRTAPHPVPDGRSLVAGEALRRFVDGAPADAQFLFLISGGASSLVESLAGESDAPALAELNRRLLADGLPIHAMNRIRRSVSLLKGGRLGTRLRGRRALALFVSDVHGDDPAVIGSGLLVPPAEGGSRPADCPARYRDLLVPAPPGPEPGDGRLAGLETVVVASNRDALAGAKEALEDAARPVTIDGRFLDGEATREGSTVATALRHGESGGRIWGGEPTVVLPERPGEGGRMQSLALAAAQRLDGVPGVSLLAAGTDGLDGTGGAAGAVVDSHTLARGRAAGWDAAAALAQADAGGYLAATGDQLVIGPTGTNVMDIVIGWRRHETAAAF